LQEDLRQRDVDTYDWPRAPFLYRRPINFHGRRLAEDILKLREKLDEPITLVGWSEGGLISVSSMMQSIIQTHDNPEKIVRRVITFGTPFHGAWSAEIGWLVDPLLGTSIREMRPSSPTLKKQVSFLHEPRSWDFQAIFGTNDLLVRPRQPDLDPSWCHYGPWYHRSPLYDSSLYELIHRLITTP
jgi:pimeloyl-ACP methyl ester carboxylesterase